MHTFIPTTSFWWYHTPYYLQMNGFPLEGQPAVGGFPGTLVDQVLFSSKCIRFNFTTLYPIANSDRQNTLCCKKQVQNTFSSNVGEMWCGNKEEGTDHMKDSVKVRS